MYIFWNKINLIMEQLLEKLQEIKRIAVNSSPVIEDLTQEAIQYLIDNPTFTKEEVMEKLNRIEGIETDD